jgi:hypothetical protein
MWETLLCWAHRQIHTISASNSGEYKMQNCEIGILMCTIQNITDKNYSLE